MSERFWKGPRSSLALVAVTAAGAVAITGCGGGSGNAASSPGTTSPGATSPAAMSSAATSSAGMAAANMPASYSAIQLRDALLAKVNGVSPARAAEDGEYGALPDVKTSKQSMHGVVVKPAECAQATVTGFNSAAFTNSPASVVTFRVGRDGVSEVIVAAAPQTAIAALATKLPAACAHYRATVDGKTFAYSVKEAPVSGVAEQARALNVKAAGYPNVNVWSVVYRARGLVGAVTIVGPDASEQGAKVLAKDAYTKASSSLH
jgi:hypothetical protein